MLQAYADMSLSSFITPCDPLCIIILYDLLVLFDHDKCTMNLSMNGILLRSDPALHFVVPQKIEYPGPQADHPAQKASQSSQKSTAR